MRVLIADDESLAREDTKAVIKKIKPEAELVCADNYVTALEAAREKKIDVAMLDIEMPGMSGLELAVKLKEINPDVNIIFVTAYSKYALEAHSMYASGYLLKPIVAEEAVQAFSNLRHPVPCQTNREQLKVQCFGNFEVFYHDEPVNFPRAKAKEIFAYLVDLKGAAANTGKLCAVLWEDSTEVEKNRHYLRNLISDIKKTLHTCHADEVFYCKRNQFAIDPDKIECDYYNFLKKDVSAINSYHGDYMKQYSWAELSFGWFNER